MAPSRDVGRQARVARDSIDKTIDQHNNYVGRLFGSHVHEVTWAAWPAAWALYFCDEAWRRGWLWKQVGQHIYTSTGRLIR